ncbi:MAG: hypothetical protein HY241_01730 [Actinobacteria bacterium]|nr:hypothetical protein [Actinomycetota bacterium]
MRAGRVLLVLAGVVALGFGVWSLLAQAGVTGSKDVLTWLAAGVVGHDGVLAPVVFGTGWLLARSRVRRVPRLLGPLLVLTGVCLLLVVPAWQSPAGAGNPTVHPAASAGQLVGAGLAAVGVLGAAHLVAGRLGAGRPGAGRLGAGRPGAGRLSGRARRNGARRAASDPSP